MTGPSLTAAHNHTLEAIKEMDHARAANHYDMAGHGAKAEEHLRAAEHELQDAIEAARAAPLGPSTILANRYRPIGR